VPGVEEGVTEQTPSGALDVSIGVARDRRSSFACILRLVNIP
jgi:hypothetical protein